MSSHEARAFVTKSSSTSASTTSLNAMPPMIIGPMLKKMREEKEKSKMPMATEGEMKGQAPGLRVGGSAWKWPPVWPYDQDFFTPIEDIAKPDPAAQLNSMAGMMSGTPAIPKPDEIEIKEQETLDAIKYWKDEKGEIKTELDEEAVEKLKK